MCVLCARVDVEEGETTRERGGKEGAKTFGYIQALIYSRLISSRGAHIAQQQQEHTETNMPSRYRAEHEVEEKNSENLVDVNDAHTQFPPLFYRRNGGSRDCGGTSMEQTPFTVAVWMKREV